MRNWLLPEYVEDVLPAEAWRVEVLRRRLLDHFAANGYELVMPPLIEYLESLLTGTGHDLDLRTFKLVDQLSGRMLGVRADITPQVARIDAHLLNRPGVTRLAYCGTVLHALPTTASHSREVLQIGAELYGHGGVESDIEIQGLMLDALSFAGVTGMHLDLGHVGLFRALCRTGGIDRDLERELFQALQGKDLPSLRDLTAALPAASREPILRLPDLFGGAEVISEARKVLPDLPEIASSLDELQRICDALKSRVDALLVDLAELRGYHYHSGAVFAAYATGSSNAVAQGGRYDEVGRAFGRARPATGFSLDLRALAELAGPSDKRTVIHAPASGDPALREAIARLRAQGEAVIVDLPGEREALGNVPLRELVAKDGHWQVVSVG
ncbi:MAG: ATP phosphoribosyltransferase regulatory subunit [Betaproteobacteria bacterium]|nr:ATP phosphoribosyltransferase regulatory subunit [Betaproteobacteria bacterium]